ncbi:hypothetical protein GCHA_0358 [Paraglaciecola chathamensis S18K6]|uniref:Uncharacterized protein n=1 Tax=Paraglaciecola chathamensis S18K6 TaxID=1127672 RepID=A0AAV3UTB0_9ALTE|nr:hypothetical protein GCHA_0358 [Paraglaciecola chathamensis S18K6]
MGSDHSTDLALCNAGLNPKSTVFPELSVSFSLMTLTSALKPSFSFSGGVTLSLSATGKVLDKWT